MLHSSAIMSTRASFREVGLVSRSRRVNDDTFSKIPSPTTLSCFSFGEFSTDLLMFFCFCFTLSFFGSSPFSVQAHILGISVIFLCFICFLADLWARWNMWHVNSVCEVIRADNLAKSRRWSRKHAYRISHNDIGRGFCWLLLFKLPWEVAAATGPALRFHRPGLSEFSFEGFLRVYPANRPALIHSVVRDCHLKRGSVSPWKDDSPYMGIVQGVLDTSLATHSAAIGQPKVGELFTKAFKSAIIVSTGLTRAQRSRVQRDVQHNITFTDERPVVTDHPEMRAFREICRTVFDRLYDVRNTSRKTLCVGAGRQESIYFGNKSIDHYYHCSEGKDYERITAWILEDIGRYINQRSKKHSALRKKKDEAKLSLELKGLAEVISRFKEVGELPQKFLTKLTGKEKYETLVFQDSSYNFGAQDWYEIFKKTEAKVAYCYSLLPYELLFPDMPPNDLYNLTYSPISGNARFTYGAGSYSNGYEHNHASWSLPLTRPVLNFPDFSIMFEIDARAGPMAVFKAVRVDGPSVQSVVRSISLPKHLHYVRILDTFASCKADGTYDPKWFSVASSEFWETVNYASSLDTKSVTFQNILAFVRRRGGGVSLVNKELLEAWNLRQSRYAAFCMTVYLYVKRQTLDVDRISNWESDFRTTATFLGRLVNLSKSLDPKAFLERLLYSTKILDDLVIFQEDALDQKEYIKVLRKPGTPTHRISVGVDDEGLCLGCDVCSTFLPRRGKQVIRCEEGDPEVTIRMTTEELNDLRTSLINTDGDAGGLKKVKEEAAKALPFTGFEKTVKMHYVLGGPGCGKSYLIRTLAKLSDGIALPFTKLISDYQGVEQPDGSFQDLLVKTHHRAIRDLRGIDNLYIDEFTALPYELIKVIIYLSGVENVYIVGDTKQTKVQPSEGLYIGDHVDIDSLPRHTLLRNFRNPKDAVHILNTVYGYDMQAMSDVEQSIKVWAPGDGVPEHECHSFSFSHGTCEVRNLRDDSGKDRTVRTYQGSTIKVPATLYINADDEVHLENSSLSIVALSRHTEELNIVHNGSDAVRAWLEKHSLPFSSVGAEPLETITCEHDQEEPAPEPDDQKLGRIFTDLKPSGKIYVPWFRFDLTFSRLLSILFISRKLLIGTSFLGISVSSLFQTRVDQLLFFLKVCYMSRLFGIASKSWVGWLEGAMRGLALSATITGICNLVVLPLRVLFPELLIVFPNKVVTPNVEHPAIAIIAKYLPFVSTQLIHQGKQQLIELINKIPPPLSTFVFSFAGWYEAMGYTRFNELGFLNQYSVFCSVIDPWIPNLVCSWVIGTKWFPREDVLLSLEIPDLRTDVSKLSELVHGNAVSEKMSSYVEWYMSYIPSSIRKWNKLPSLPDVKIPIPSMITPRDAWLYAKESLPAWADVRVGLEYPNALSAAVITNTMRTGKMTVAEFLTPVNARGHPKRNPGLKYSFGVLAGHKFTPNQPFQLLSTLAGRYFNKKATVNADPEKALGEIMLKARLELFDDKISGWDEDALDELASEFFKSAEAKHYEAQFVGQDNPDARKIRFHLKSIFKPSLSAQKPMDPSKVGQGISAWSKDAQIMFGLCAKWINFVFLNSLKSNVIFDNRMTEQTLRTRVRANWSKIPSTALNGITDFEMFDSQQDKFSQALEKSLLRHIGVSEEFIDHYYSFREGGTLLAAGVSGRLGTEKTSGEPLTLFGNSVISMLLANFLIRGDGPFLLAFKGDDGFKRQANLKVSEENKALLSGVCRLKIKAHISEVAEFCGFSIGPTAFAPSIPRKLCKLLGHEFADYAHFSEYRKSLLDWLRDVKSQDTNEIIATNASLFTTADAKGYLEVEQMLETISSISHIGEEDWHRALMKLGDPLVLQERFGEKAKY